jgi:uncharacterized protein (DUF305 family)
VERGGSRKEESQMKYPTRTTAALLATAALAACNSQSANNEAPAQAPAAENASATASDASNPFADAEQKMSQAMMSAVGTDVGDNWAKKMIAHHQGAIDMSQVVLAQNPTPDVAMMAREAIEKQQKDIENIRKLLKNGAPDQKSADLYRPAMMDMQQKMQAAKGADVSETFMRKMLEHHKGAVAMSDIALQNGVSGALKTQIQKTRDENRKDAAMVEAMLRGESMSHAMADSGAKSAEQARKEPAPVDKASDHSAHDMNQMGNMDMNHM